MDKTVTSQLLNDIKNSSQVHDESEDIIVALVKIQRSMEISFNNKMERDFKCKSDEANKLIEKMTKTVDGRLEKMRVSVSKCMKSMIDNSY